MRTDISKEAPAMWDGDVTTDFLRSLLSGLEIPNEKVCIRLAYELLQEKTK